MVIESAEYAQMQSNFFDVLWDSQGCRRRRLGAPVAPIWAVLMLSPTAWTDLVRP